VLQLALRLAYRCCDLIVDIGLCMRDVLGRYGSRAQVETLTPWALVEPAAPALSDPTVRRELFGDAKLGLLYSGTFGRAHSYEEFLALARLLRSESIAFCFAGRGNRADQLRQAITPEDTNIRFAGFASEEDLEKRLGAADIHLVSLQPSWTGTVVPSKFFGSLAIGRPVIFAGSEKAAIAQWIRAYDLGWLLQTDSLEATASALRDLARAPDKLASLHQRCHRVYHDQFAREHVIDGWDRALRQLLPSQVSKGV
jgi:glycosyltransferase involved in cell wall biosynthesis